MKEIEEIDKLISTWSISYISSMQTFFFFNFLDKGRERTSATCLKPETSAHLGAAFINMCEKKGLPQNIVSKLVSKVTKKKSNAVLKLWSEPPCNRPKSIKFLYERALKIWIISYVEGCLFAYKVWDYKPRMKLQRITVQFFETVPEVASQVGNSCNWFSNSTCLRLSQSQVTLPKNLSEY